MDCGWQTKQLTSCLLRNCSSIKTNDMKKISLLVVVAIAFAFTMNSCYYDKAELVYPQGCDTTNIRYSVQVSSIISNNCYTCHSNANAASLGAGFKLEGHANLVAWTNGGANSRLIKAIDHSGPFDMPKGQPKLSDCQVNQVLAWVLRGAPNN